MLKLSVFCLLFENKLLTYIVYLIYIMYFNLTCILNEYSICYMHDICDLVKQVFELLTMTNDADNSRPGSSYSYVKARTAMHAVTFTTIQWLYSQRKQFTHKIHVVNQINSEYDRINWWSLTSFTQKNYTFYGPRFSSHFLGHFMGTFGLLSKTLLIATRKSSDYNT